MSCLTLMVQGTASSVGKSLLVTALCRLFRQEGLRVAPFKSQNMALNSFVTADGAEIGRAQGVQAEAAGIEPTVQMNPILLKPEGDSRSQVVLLGKPLRSMSATEYHAYKPELKNIITDCLTQLRARYDLIVIEGAGSPAEINLKDRDIVNMYVAHQSDARVLLVGDIDRGGVFAAFVGTLELLTPDERARIGAFVINKFRGDVSLLTPGIEFLHNRTKVPVLGVLPYLSQLRIADEDSVSIDDRAHQRSSSSSSKSKGDSLDIAIVRLPRISNHDDFQPLEHEPDLTVRFVHRPDQLANADLVILPGSKSTVSDFTWLRTNGFAEWILERAQRAEPILGICGGFQMLGMMIEDPDQVESSSPRVDGLGLLPVRVHFERHKTTVQSIGRVARLSFLGDPTQDQEPVRGYEIHMGKIQYVGPACPAFEIVKHGHREARIPDGSVSDNGAVVGTMLHGLFENDMVRNRLITALRVRRGLGPAIRRVITPPKDAEYDRLATVLRECFDMDLLRSLVGLNRGVGT